MYTEPSFIILITSVLLIILLSLKSIKAVTCEYDPMLNKVQTDLVAVDPKASRLKFFTSNESYTEDKERVFLCLKDEHENYYPYQMLLEVGLHELAHANTSVIDIDHVTSEFNDELNRLRNKAIDLGLLKSNVPLVSNYCPKKHV